MKSVYPYHVVHLTTDGNSVKPLAASNDHGYYIVFWHDDVPIGDCYIEKGISFPGKTFTASDLPRSSPAIIPATVDVSVVICTRNRSHDLSRCLTALQKQRSKPAEIIVVDNAPTDRSTLLVTERFNNVKYICEPRAGLDIARNCGATNATSAIIAYTDDDVEPHPLWLYELYRSFNDPYVQAMTGLVIAKELETESQQVFEKHWSFNRGYQTKLYTHEFYTSHRSLGPPVWEIGAGANMAFRKSIFTDIGYFDERLDVGAAGCNGDSEMWFRILKNKGNILYNPRAVAFHLHRRQMKQLKKQLFNYMRGFAAAALIQQQSDKNINYTRHLFKQLPAFYVRKIIRHFPFYPSRYKTIFQEMFGLCSGMLFFIRNRNNRQ